MIWAIVFIFILYCFPPYVSAGVVINEIFPKSNDVNFTWVELYNFGNTSISLDRWKLETNSSGSYILNASSLIQPNGFLTLFYPQTGISFNIQGDTIRLLDDRNTLLDSQSYAGTLGYNTSMGRNPDGGTGWTICAPNPEYVSTPDKSNKCPPAPTAIATLTATPAPLKSPTPTPTTFLPTATPQPFVDSSSNFAFPDTPKDTPKPTPTPTQMQQPDTYKKTWTLFLTIGTGAGLIIMSIGLYKTLKR